MERQVLYLYFKTFCFALLNKTKLIVYVLSIAYNDILWIDKTLNFTLIGRLSNDYTLLEEVEETRIQFITKYKSLIIAEVPNRRLKFTNMKHILPVKISYNPHQQRLSIQPTKILYFNR